jgi:hypothetical protein
METDKMVADLKKGLIGEGTTLATSGALQPVQANRFIDFVYDETAVGRLGVRQERFDPSDKYIDKLNVGQWVVYPKREASDPRVRSGVNTSRITLTPQEFVVVWQISDQFLRRNLERANAEEHIMQMMAKKAANNLETCLFHGNLLGPAMTEAAYYGTTDDARYVKNATMGSFDGWLKLARSGNVVDAENKPITPDLIMSSILAMPTKFQQRPNAVLLPTNLNHRYNARVAGRATAAGDGALSGNDAPGWGLPRKQVPLLMYNPLVVEHITLTGTTAVNLQHTNITDVVVLPNSLEGTAITPYVEDTDYEVDTAAGTIARLGGGALTNPQTVKVTYSALPQYLLTDPSNLIVAIGRDMKFNTEYRGVEDMWVFSMHLSVSAQIEETDASVLVRNIASS